MDNLKQITHIDNVRLGEDKASVVIIDQTKLPSRTHPGAGQADSYSAA